MKILTLDVETLTHKKGNPFSSKNKLVTSGFSSSIYGYVELFSNTEQIQKLIDEHDLLVGFNIKFDIHWLMNIGVVFDPEKHKIWDCQLFEYVKSFQRKRYISLQETCDAYGFEGKIDLIKEEYWDKGVDTDQIPIETLSEYLKRDVLQTEKVFKQQFSERNSHPWFITFRRDCCDIWSLIEMERNGLLLDVQGMEKELNSQLQAKEDLLKKLGTLAPYVPVNWASGDHVSCILYGGTIVDKFRVPVGVYKTGGKIGETRYRIEQTEYTFERIFEPPKRSELKKKGYYSTAEDNLLRIKCPKSKQWIIDSLIEIGKIDKLVSSYLEKLPRMLDEYCWEDETLHGTYNNNATVTARIASDKPNVQNNPPIVKQYIVSRYATT